MHKTSLIQLSHLESDLDFSPVLTRKITTYSLALLCSLPALVCSAQTATVAGISNNAQASPFSSTSSTPIKVLTLCEVLFNSLVQWQSRKGGGLGAISATVTQSIPVSTTVPGPWPVDYRHSALTRYGVSERTNKEGGSIPSVLAEANNGIEFDVYLKDNTPDPIFADKNGTWRYKFIIVNNGGAIMQSFVGETNNPTSPVLAGQLQCRDSLMFGFIGDAFYTVNFRKDYWPPEIH